MVVIDVMNLKTRCRLLQSQRHNRHIMVNKKAAFWLTMLLVVPFVASADNLADFFTKPLPASVFFPLRDRIMGARPA